VKIVDVRPILSTAMDGGGAWRRYERSSAMKGHKWFASVYDRMLASQEKGYLGAYKRWRVSLQRQQITISRPIAPVADGSVTTPVPCDLRMHSVCRRRDPAVRNHV
jgi:hypothetical protein